ncbi:TrbI F-type domain-containing protein [Pasteurella multocida]|uniref:TrbI F-type domain-containing protein n=1 Tax=Pasteurella multocida TaxID=747 RepID=UPI002FE0A25D
MENSTKKIILAIFFIATITNIIFNGFIYFSQPKIIAFDIKGTTDIFLKQVIKLELEENEKANLVKRFEKITSEVIEEYSVNHVVLVKNAILSRNIEDKTAEIKMKIAEKMAK